MLSPLTFGCESFPLADEICDHGNQEGHDRRQAVPESPQSRRSPRLASNHAYGTSFEGHLVPPARRPKKKKGRVKGGLTTSAIYFYVNAGAPFRVASHDDKLERRDSICRGEAVASVPGENRIRSQKNAGRLPSASSPAMAC